MIEPGRAAPLRTPIHTPWGIYQPGHIVTVLSGLDGQLVVCLDSDGHHDGGHCHKATIPTDALFTWPDHVQHGTPKGYRTHLANMDTPCQDCRDAYNQKAHADRIRGQQPTLTIPRTFLAELLDHAPLPLLAEADKLWGAPVVDAIRDA